MLNRHSINLRVAQVCCAHPIQDRRVTDRAGRSLAEAGYEVHIYGKGESFAVKKDGNLVLHSFPTTSSRFERYRIVNRILREVARLDPHIIQVHEPILLTRVLRRFPNASFIWDVHECYLEVLKSREWIPKLVRPVIAKWWDIVERRALRRCDVVVAATDEVAERYLRMGCCTDVIANFPRFQDFEPSKSLPVREAGLCIYAGTITANRGLEEVFQIAAHAQREHVPFRVEIAGKGEANYMSFLEKSIQELGISRNVALLGLLDHQQLMNLYGRASLGLIPHRHENNNLYAWPVKGFEYMAASVPFIYSPLGTHQTLFGSHRLGWEVDFMNPSRATHQILTLLGNPSELVSMANHAYGIARKHYSWESEKNKLLSIYKSLAISRHNQRRPYSNAETAVSPNSP